MVRVGVSVVGIAFPARPHPMVGVDHNDVPKELVVIVLVANVIADTVRSVEEDIVLDDAVFPLPILQPDSDAQIVVNVKSCCTVIHHDAVVVGISKAVVANDRREPRVPLDVPSLVGLLDPVNAQTPVVPSSPRVKGSVIV